MLIRKEFNAGKRPSNLWGRGGFNSSSTCMELLQDSAPLQAAAERLVVNCCNYTHSFRFPNVHMRSIFYVPLKKYDN